MFQTCALARARAVTSSTLRLAQVMAYANILALRGVESTFMETIRPALVLIYVQMAHTQTLPPICVLSIAI